MQTLKTKTSTGKTSFVPTTEKKCSILRSQFSIVLLLAAIMFTSQTQNLFAQTEEPAAIKQVTGLLNSGWQISGRIGYDLPAYKKNFIYIDHKGGIASGLSVNKFWGLWGFQMDADYIKNSAGVSLPDLKYIESNGSSWQVFDYQSSETYKKSISRTFIGAGPAYRYVAPKLTVYVATMGGLGTVNGGEVLAVGVRSNATKDVLAYHSGFENVSTFSIKTQARLNWSIKPKLGLNAGFYYLNHLGVQEAQKNTFFKELQLPWSYTYYYEELRKTEDVGTGFYPNTAAATMRIWNGEKDDRAKISISSFGVFVGLTYRLSN